MIVTVSVRKSPPYSPSDECNAMSSFSSTDVVETQKERRENIHTSATVDDAMMWAEYKFKDFRDRPRNNSLWDYKMIRNIAQL